MALTKEEALMAARRARTYPKGHGREWATKLRAIDSAGTSLKVLFQYG